jgi:hypothetical protein
MVDWVPGETLLGFISRRYRDPTALAQVRAELREFAREQTDRGYAHGDVQLWNILVTDRRKLKFVDYDGMFVPTLRGLRVADAGHPHFQSSNRTVDDYGPNLDRFSLIVLDLTLEAMQLRPDIFDRYHQGENLVLTRNDFRNPATSMSLDEIAQLPNMRAKTAWFRDLCDQPLQDIPSLDEFQGRPHATPRQINWGESDDCEMVTEYEEYYPSLPVVDGMDYQIAVRHVGQSVELIGQVIRVFRSGNITLLRFGPKYHQTPSLVVPNSTFDQWGSSDKMKTQPWVSATGVLQRHKSGNYTTVQITIREMSDIEILASPDFAAYRLGRKRIRKQVRRPKVRPSTAPAPGVPGLPGWLSQSNAQYSIDGSAPTASESSNSPAAPLPDWLATSQPPSALPTVRIQNSGQTWPTPGISATKQIESTSKPQPPGAVGAQSGASRSGFGQRISSIAQGLRRLTNWVYPRSP